MIDLKEFDELVKDYVLNELLILDKEYKRQGRDIEKEGIEQEELKHRVWNRIINEHPEVADMEKLYMGTSR